MREKRAKARGEKYRKQPLKKKKKCFKGFVAEGNSRGGGGRVLRI